MEAPVENEEYHPAPGGQNDPEAPHFEWEALEFFYREKDSDWYWMVGLALFVLVVIAVLLKNFLLVLVLIIGSFMIFRHAESQPEVLRLAVSPKGVRVQNTLYPFRRLSSFWVSTDGLHPKLMLKSDRYFLPYIILPLGFIDAETVRETLLAYLPEEEHEESIVELLLEYLGF